MADAAYYREYYAKNRDRELEKYRRYRKRHEAERKDFELQRRELIAAYKIAAGCIDCGYSLHPAALDFDHRNPAEKSGNVGHLIFGNLDRLMAEIAKCDVRCANCHRIRSQAQRLGGRPTGSADSYQRTRRRFNVVEGGMPDAG